MGISKSPPTVFSRRLKEARLAAGIPQDRLGVMIGLDEGCSSARISRYENGIHAPSFGTVKRLGEILNLPTAYFYCEDDGLAELVKAYFRGSAADRKQILANANIENLLHT